MTLLGWIFLITSLTFVWSLTAWCFYKVLTVEDVETIAEPPVGLGP
ncbi:MAG: hypothetical protein ACREQQ_08960 [Candidatus Binatia bacterium]